MACKCGGRSFDRDETTERRICAKCGMLQEFDSWDAQIGGIRGPTGTNLYIGSSGTGFFLNYKDKKIFKAKDSIKQYLEKLGITNLESKITSMISEITDGEFGLGDWFEVLIGACCYVVMRSDGKFLPAAEVAEVIQCDIFELGRMISRLVKFKNLILPEVSIASLFERALSNSPSFRKMGVDDKERMRNQGVFLVNCAVKWFLTTGRRPMPVVAAVMVFVAKLNGVDDVRIEEVAGEVRAAVSTCKSRYRELLQALVNVAQALPWGKDVTVKNLMKYAPFVMRYLEMKSMEKPGGESGELEGGLFDLDEVISECLAKDVAYGDNGRNIFDAPYFGLGDRIGSPRLGSDDVDNNLNFIGGDRQNFDGEDRSRFPRLGTNNLETDVNCMEGDTQKSGEENRSELPMLEFNNVDKLKLSHECLSLIYTKFLNEVDCGRLTGLSGMVCRRKPNSGFELNTCRDWWNGKSELSKKLLLKQILEKDIGFNPMPPSFMASCIAKERRRERINAAKLRIHKIMHPTNTNLCVSGNSCLSDYEHAGKKRKRKQKSDIDWEDFIIETLLLHQVKEAEIEKGHYNTLLDLHVFNSGVM